jgi:hypothetical protein
VAASATSRFSRRTFRRMKEYLPHHTHHSCEPSHHSTANRRQGEQAHQWFLTWLSVRPGSLLAISLHLLPSSLHQRTRSHGMTGQARPGQARTYRCASAMMRSSSSVHAFLLMLGSERTHTIISQSVRGVTDGQPRRVRHVLTEVVVPALSALLARAALDVVLCRGRDGGSVHCIACCVSAQPSRARSPPCVCMSTHR